MTSATAVGTASAFSATKRIRKQQAGSGDGFAEHLRRTSTDVGGHLKNGKFEHGM